MEETNGSEEETTVRVAVRCRPFNSKEKANGETSCVKIKSDQVVLVNPSGSGEEHSFAFDLVIDENATQESVWLNVGVPILNKAFNGFNGTIFAYGQTGSGKTWSMQGAEGSDLEGIIPRMNNQLFERVSIEVKKRPTTQFLITVSYFEIYNEVIFDLLDSSDRKKRSAAAKGGLEIKEHPILGVYVKGLQELVVDSAGKLQSIIDQGMRNRTVASTQMNADSSRSHSVFIINLHQKDVEDESKNVFAKVNLVDLAGSERVKSTGATGSTLKEGANINKSLSALGNVINALVEASKGKGAFIPYRNSKLTRVLQESLGGNSITAMLAALSPAACNFEETLSTLKYANRAKAIKVKAVKNEQSSQISKLNDEIRALKEKLMSQGGAGAGTGMAQDGNQDSSALEEKNRQRLRDLEDAMRSTWEAKSKQSEEYERERQALLIEQQNAARQFEAARQRNWMLLEQKGDLEISLSHVRTLTSDRLSQAPVGVLLAQWTEQLREVSTLERQLVEQETVVQVYRGSLEKDCQAVVQQQCGAMKNGSVVVFDNSAFSMLRQLKDKISISQREMVKWTHLQDELLTKVLQVVHIIKEAGSARAILNKTNSALLAAAEPQTDASTSSSASPLTTAHTATSALALTKDEKKELHRGLGLIRKQVVLKYRQIRQSVSCSRTDYVAFDSVRLDLVKLLSLFDGTTSPDAQLSVTEGTEVDEAVSAVVQGITSQALSMRERLESGAVLLVEVFRRLEHAIQACISAEQRELQQDAPVGGSAVTATQIRDGSPQVVVGEEIPIESVMIHSFNNDMICNPRMQAVDHRRSSTKLDLNESSSSFSAGVVSVDSVQSWACTLSKFEEKGSLILYLPTVQPVTSIQIQGGWVCAEKIAVEGMRALPVPMQLSGEAFISNVSLPCGLTLSSVEPRHELTSAALADVFDWTELIKSNPPEKFLKRPPVRFLFDLIKFVGTSNPGFLDEHLQAADWATVGADKTSKLDFMEKMILFITKSVCASEPITSSGSIVTGSDPELTNILLQQLAIALFAHQNKPDTSGLAAPASVLKASTAPAQASAPAIQEAWVSVVRVEISKDGQDWRLLDEMDTGLQTVNQAISLPLHKHHSVTSLQCSYVRLTPMKWNGDGKFGPALRVTLLGPEASSEDEGEEASVGMGAQLLPSNSVSEVVEALHSTVTILIEAAEFVSRKEEANKELKQLEVKKNLENLARDKLALESLMASEKKSLESDNQDLAEKLKSCFNQLKETQGLLEKEQQINAQLDQQRLELEEEKSAVQKSLSEKDEENAQLRATILGLQASAEKDKSQIEQLQEKLTDSEKSVETLQDQLQQAEEARASSEHEREELLSQIMILTEERDGARAQEEELFEKLGERTNDLDRLRESYVEITDRWNDSQDEAMDLRDKLESMQSALEARSFLHSASPAIFSSFPASAPAASQYSSFQQADGAFSSFSIPQSSSLTADALPKEVDVTATAEGQSPRREGAGSKAAKAVPPGGSRGAKASPRGKPVSAVPPPSSAVAAEGAGERGYEFDRQNMLLADEKDSLALPFSGSSPPGRNNNSNASASTGLNNNNNVIAAEHSSSPRKPPPAPVPTLGAGDYADDDFEDYEEEFEAED